MSVATAAATAGPATLEALLAPTALRIRTVGFRLIKLMTSLTGQHLAPEDIQHLALTAAFEGFLELGGNPETPDTFDWDGSTTALEKRGLLWLKRETLGRNSEFGDVATRLSPRKTGAFVEAYRWTAWQYAAFEQPGRRSAVTAFSGGVVRLEYPQPLPQDTAFETPDLSTFLTDLAAVLDTQSFQWLVERFRDGVTQNEQIARLVAETPSYQTEGGWKRAENYVNKKVSRARKRAAAVLGDRWATVAREVSA